MINVVSCVFILDSEENSNNKKNDIKRLRLLVNSDNELISSVYNFDDDLKKVALDKISDITGTKNIHMEQVYALGDKKYVDKKNLDIIYLGLTNIDNIKNIKDGYKLVDIMIIDGIVKIGNNVYKYKTIKNTEKSKSNYIHKVNVHNIELEKILIEILTAYKYLRSRIDNTDIIFNLLPEVFTLEDVRIVYEKIKNINVDKSNFRKKIQKYLIRNDDIIRSKGYRPATTYRFNREIEEIWL